jgi:hypothetical protein
MRHPRSRLSGSVVWTTTYSTGCDLERREALMGLVALAPTLIKSQAAADEHMRYMGGEVCRVLRSQICAKSRVLIEQSLEVVPAVL